MDLNEFFERYDRARLNAGKIASIRVMELAGLHQDTFRNARRRNVPPSVEEVLAVAKVLGVGPFYLLEPIGVSKSLFETGTSSEHPCFITDDPSEAELLSVWRRLSSQDKESALKIMKALLPD